MLYRFKAILELRRAFCSTKLRMATDRNFVRRICIHLQTVDRIDLLCSGVPVKSDMTHAVTAICSNALADFRNVNVSGEAATLM